MTPVLVLWIGIALLALAVTGFVRLLTHHTVMWLPRWGRPIRTTRHDTYANDRTQPRRAAR